MSSMIKVSRFSYRIFANHMRIPILSACHRCNISQKFTSENSEMNSIESFSAETSQSDLISESLNDNLPAAAPPKRTLSEVIAKLSQELDSLSESPSSNDLQIRPLPSAVLAPAGNLAALVNECAALRRLLCEGVDLAALEAVPGVPNFLIKLDVEREIEPLVRFLADPLRLALSCASALDTPAKQPTEVGTVLQAAPRLLQTSLDELAIRLDYFASKRFSWSEVRRLVLGAPTLLTRAVHDIDAQLGAFQKEFRLTGAEVRATILSLPILIISDFKKIRDKHLLARRTLGFTEPEIKQLVLAEPSILLATRAQLMAAVELLHLEMQLPHARIARSPVALLAHPRTLRERHLFLRSVARDQYDPTRPQYVSLEALARFDDPLFAEAAGVSLDEFHKYLKTR